MGVSRRGRSGGTTFRLFPETEARRKGLSRPSELGTDRGGDPLVGKPVRRAGHADRTDHLAGVVAHGGTDAAQPLLEFLEIDGVAALPHECDLLDEYIDIDPC